MLDHLPRGYTLDEEDWQRRHTLLLWVLAVHIPGLALFGIVLHHSAATVLYLLVAPLGCLVLGRMLRRRRRTASVLVTGGLVYCSAALVGLTNGTIEAHFHFFIIIGFIALYQDWAPFLFNILFTVISHGVGSWWQGSLMFNHPAAQANPWLWSLIHGLAVLVACVGMMLFWRVTEEQQQQKDAFARRLSEAELGRQQFTSDLLVNLARRNQSMLYRQLDIINQLEESERDPDALAGLFRLDHLATRVRRNAESLLVLSGEQAPRVWSEPVLLRDVVRAAIAETEDLERVVFVVDERPAVVGHTVTDLTHLIAELTENAVRFSPPDTSVTIRARPDGRDEGGHLVTVEDGGVGMPVADLAAANALLAHPPEVDLSVAQRLGLHVIARLAARHSVGVSLGATPGSGITAIVAVPSRLFAPTRPGPVVAAGRHAEGDRVVRGQDGAHARPTTRIAAPAAATGDERVANEDVAAAAAAIRSATVAGPGDGTWHGWWDPAAAEAVPVSGGPNVAAPAPTPPLPRTPRPRPRAAPPATPPTSGNATTGLRGRVPQTHLAPELREPMPDAGTVAPGRTADAARALSRYQASRKAARDIVERDGEWRL